MTTSLFAALGILAPVHGFLRRFAFVGATPTRLISPRRSSPIVPAVAQPARPQLQPAMHRARQVTRNRSRVVPPLRVVRVLEAGQSSAHGGRMVISGRMADVCAELERMAAREAGLQTSA